MPGGRPTNDPKETLVAVRLAERQLAVLRERARGEGVSLSESLRRCVDEWAAARTVRPPARTRQPSPAEGPTSKSPSRTRPPTPEERETFREVFAALGLKPARRGGRPKRR